MRHALSILILSLGLFASAVQGAEPEIDFAKQVQPILSQNCFGCHGPEKTKGHLRLDVKTLAMEGGTSGPSSQGCMSADRATATIGARTSG